MGFLFDMLEKAGGLNCQATNFLKTFNGLPGTTQLGLDEENALSRTLAQMIQIMNRYILEVAAAALRETNKASAGAMDSGTATLGLMHIRCSNCGNESFRNDGIYVHELVYPSRNQSRPQPKFSGPLFSHVLKASVERTDQTRGWCDRCKRYQHLLAQKRVRTVPPVLTINTAIQTLDARQCWAKPGWLPQEIGIIVDQGNFFCFEGQDLRHHLQRGAYKIEVYELVGTVVDISAGDVHKPHLVSIINCTILDGSDSKDGWHLFNDFLVRPIPPEEALRFDPSWKLPAVVTYQQKRYRGHVDNEWKLNLDTSLLYQHGPMRSRLEEENVQPLSFPFEGVKQGMLVGIDSEFVSLQQEEIEIRPDGSRATLRPSRLALARVSVLRGGVTVSKMTQDLLAPMAGGADAGSDGNNTDYTPFLDDYIHISEPIVDYLTAYSGISPGDLSPTTSRYASTGRLVSLKTAYKKLWLLLNLGCVFVGHGLAKDFRTINIHIPKAQVVDTVELFFSKRNQRKLSLRFLSWILLGERVQIESDGKGHDSVEDARMALRLWAKWEELEIQGKTERTIEGIYRKGRETGFRVPLVTSPPQRSSGALSGRVTPLSEFEDVASVSNTPGGRIVGYKSNIGS